MPAWLKLGREFAHITGAELTAFVPHRPARPEKTEGGRRFTLVSEYQPAGDQPQAIEELCEGLAGEGSTRVPERDQVLLGVTGSGKTFTMAKVLNDCSGRHSFLRQTRHWRRSSIPR